MHGSAICEIYMASQQIADGSGVFKHLLGQHLRCCSTQS